MAADYETVTGLVAREIDVGDADRYLTILTAEAGKIECYAKGIRNKRSKLASSAGLLTFGEFKMFVRRERRTLMSAKAVERFSPLSNDILSYAFATHFLEIARDAIMDEEPFPEALQTLLNALFVLAYQELDIKLVARVFELRMLGLSGFMPTLDRCSVCGESAERTSKSFCFDAFGDGLICETCANRGASCDSCAHVSRGAISAMRYVTTCEARDIFSFHVSEAVADELNRLIPPFLENQFGRTYPRLAEADRYEAFEEEARSIAKRMRESARNKGCPADYLRNLDAETNLRVLEE